MRYCWNCYKLVQTYGLCEKCGKKFNHTTVVLVNSYQTQLSTHSLTISEISAKLKTERQIGLI